MIAPNAQERLTQIVEPLLFWYQKNKRSLPWRDQPTPYRVWVSEIMLQQTRVEAVKPYFERFLAQLPSIQALASCPEDRLLKLWEGLGYYSRARNLQKTARLLVEQYDGQLPADYRQLTTLPDPVPVLTLAFFFLFFSCIVRISPHFYRTIVTYLCSFAALCFSNISLSVRLGFLLITAGVFLRMHLSQESKERCTIKLLWMR